MAQRIALAIWNERISPLFDASRTLLVVDVKEGHTLNREVKVLKSSCDPVSRARELTAHKIKLLICGAISIPLAKAIEASNIQIVPFTAGDIESIIASYLDGSLARADYRMPGCHQVNME